MIAKKVAVSKETGGNWPERRREPVNRVRSREHIRHARLVTSQRVSARYLAGKARFVHPKEHSMTLPSEFGSIRELRKAAREIAEAVLEANWPENSYPVDPILIAARIGVETFSAQLGNDVFGMLVKPAGSERPQIFLDLDQPANRFRFTAAHELGHYVDRSSRLDDEVAYIDKRSDNQKGNADEIWANEFAGNLLMPRPVVEQLKAEGLSRFQIADQLGVSYDALSYRMHVLATTT